MRNYGPCMCGAIDCPDCGPAQGYEVRRAWTVHGREEDFDNAKDPEDEDERESNDD